VLHPEFTTSKLRRKPCNKSHFGYQSIFRGILPQLYMHKSQGFNHPTQHPVLTPLSESFQLMWSGCQHMYTGYNFDSLLPYVLHISKYTFCIISLVSNGYVLGPRINGLREVIVWRSNYKKVCETVCRVVLS
jgi:hypothetical protein